MEQRTDEYILKYEFTPKARQIALKKLVDWFTEHEAFEGEAIWQSDNCQLDAVPLLIDLAENVFKFRVEWND